MYDPVIGLFTTADIMVQNFSNPQTLNRYSYCGNNPLAYVDPDGHGFWAALAAIASLISVKAVVIGAVVGAGISAATGGDIAMGAFTGAISGAFFGGVGNYIDAAGGTAVVSTSTQVTLHVAAGMVSGGINAAITGGNIGLGILTGGIGAGMGAYAGSLIGCKDFLPQFTAQTITGAISGGIAAEIYGGKFMDGFAMGAGSAAFGYLCNQFLHGGGQQSQEELSVIEIQRTWETPQSTISTFSIDNGRVSGYMLEPPAGRRIPAGSYPAVPHNGPRIYGVMQLQNVPGHTGVLIHSGNRPRDTTGCFLPGTSHRPNWVGGSRASMQQIMNYTNGRALVIIHDPTPVR